MRHLKKICETDAGPDLLNFIGFTNFLDVPSLSFSFFTNADVVKIKDETSK